MAHEEAVKIVDGLLMDIGSNLTETNDVVVGVIAMTNASNYICDHWDKPKARFVGKGKIEFSATITLTGDSLPDQPFSGSQIKVEITKGKLEDDNGVWKTISTEIGSAKVVDWES